VATIGELEVALSEPVSIPFRRKFIGREQEIKLCFAAWNLRDDGKSLLGDEVPPLHFRLEGPPGVGKNEIVYEIARRLKLPLYVIQGHEELTPEDLGLILVPDPAGSFRDAPLMLRASPLATAIHVGGLFFFDEINRVPERALSPLASVLDDRGTIYSALAGVHIGPGRDAGRFRFCCALNPALSDAGRGVLPEYIEERTLPAIGVGYLKEDKILELLQSNLAPPKKFLDAFEKWYKGQSRTEISARQALTLMRYAMSLVAGQGGDEESALTQAEPMVFRSSSTPPEVESPEAAESDEDEEL
jgi:AAA domain (dynein-related subfamily)